MSNFAIFWLGLPGVLVGLAILVWAFRRHPKSRGPLIGRWPKGE